MPVCFANCCIIARIACTEGGHGLSQFTGDMVKRSDEYSLNSKAMLAGPNQCLISHELEDNMLT